MYKYLYNRRSLCVVALRKFLKFTTLKWIFIESASNHSHGGRAGIDITHTILFENHNIKPSIEFTLFYQRRENETFKRRMCIAYVLLNVFGYIFHKTFVLLIFSLDLSKRNGLRL